MGKNDWFISSVHTIAEEFHHFFVQFYWLHLIWGQLSSDILWPSLCGRSCKRGSVIKVARLNPEMGGEMAVIWGEIKQAGPLFSWVLKYERQSHWNEENYLLGLTRCGDKVPLTGMSIFRGLIRNQPFQTEMRKTISSTEGSEILEGISAGCRGSVAVYIQVEVNKYLHYKGIKQWVISVVKCNWDRSFNDLTQCQSMHEGLNLLLLLLHNYTSATCII